MSRWLMGREHRSGVGACGGSGVGACGGSGVGARGGVELVACGLWLVRGGLELVVVRRLVACGSWLVPPGSCSGRYPAAAYCAVGAAPEAARPATAKAIAMSVSWGFTSGQVGSTDASAIQTPSAPR